MTLRKFIQENSLSYSDVQNATGIDRKAVYLYMKGSKPLSFEMAKKLYDAYGGTLWQWWEEGAKAMVGDDGKDVGERDIKLPPNYFHYGDLARLEKRTVVVRDFLLDEEGDIEWYMLFNGETVDARTLKMYEPIELKFKKGDVLEVVKKSPYNHYGLDASAKYEVIHADAYECKYTLLVKNLDTGESSYAHEGLFVKYN